VFNDVQWMYSFLSFLQTDGVYFRETFVYYTPLLHCETVVSVRQVRWCASRGQKRKLYFSVFYDCLRLPADEKSARRQPGYPPTLDDYIIIIIIINTLQSRRLISSLIRLFKVTNLYVFNTTKGRYYIGCNTRSHYSWSLKHWRVQTSRASIYPCSWNKINIILPNLMRISTRRREY